MGVDVDVEGMIDVDMVVRVKGRVLVSTSKYFLLNSDQNE